MIFDQANLGRWTLLNDGLTFNIFVEIMDSYHPYLQDDKDWIDFATVLRNSLLFVSTGGWIAFNEIIPGLRCHLHGASWKYASPLLVARCVADLRSKVLPSVMQTLDLHSVLVTIPTHAEKALKMCEKIGFETFGIIPDYSTWDGITHDSVIMALKKEN